MLALKKQKKVNSFLLSIEILEKVAKVPFKLAIKNQKLRAEKEYMSSKQQFILNCYETQEKIRNQLKYFFKTRCWVLVFMRNKRMQIINFSL